jgi:preprotein translocase subunit SecB
LSSSGLRLEDYYIEALKVRANDAFDRKAGRIEYDIVPKAQFFTLKDNPNRHQLFLALDTKGKPGKPRLNPYQIHISARAFFETDDGLPQEDKDRLILLNGSAILVGLLRAHIAQVTALSRYSTLLLEPINLVEALKPKDSVDELPEVAQTVATGKRRTRPTAG